LDAIQKLIKKELDVVSISTHVETKKSPAQHNKKQKTEPKKTKFENHKHYDDVDSEPVGFGDDVPAFLK